MDLTQIDALTAGLVAFFGFLLAIWSFLLYRQNHKFYTLLVAFLVLFFSGSYSVIPISYIYFVNTSIALPDNLYMLIGYTSLPLAVIIAVYMGADIFFPTKKKLFLLISLLLSFGYYISLFGFPESNFLRYRETKAGVTGMAINLMSTMLVLAILVQIVGFNQLRKRKETEEYHKKMLLLIYGWVIMLIASMFDTFATEGWMLFLTRFFSAFSLLLWYIGYSPENAVSAEIVISAPIDTVWGILVDLDKYAEWNSFTPRVSTTLTVGEEFTLDCQMTPKNLMKDVPEVMLDFQPDKYLVQWGSSRTKRKGVLGDRVQQLYAIGSDKCKYTVKETIRW